MIYSNLEKLLLGRLAEAQVHLKEKKIWRISGATVKNNKLKSITTLFSFRAETAKRFMQKATTHFNRKLFFNGKEKTRNRPYE